MVIFFFFLTPGFPMRACTKSAHSIFEEWLNEHKNEQSYCESQGTEWTLRILEKNKSTHSVYQIDCLLKTTFEIWSLIFKAKIPETESY